MRIVWLDLARDDVVRIRKHIAEDNPYAAASVAGRILEAVNQLSRTPHIGRSGRLPNTRELIITGTPYIAPYRERGKRIEILRVFHGARKWPEFL